MEENEHIESVLIKSFSGCANKEEEQEIQNWLSESEQHKSDYITYRKLWDNSNDLLLLGVLDVEEALIATKKQIPQFNNNRRYLTFFKQAAAVLLVSVVLSVTINYFLNARYSSDSQQVFQEIKSAYGTQTHLTLADGTSVWLNSGSTLSFPISFDKMTNRDVRLVGEGYFEVTKNPRQPFIVHTAEIDVKVLGTSFNVNAYENEENVVVALVEGKVSLQKEVDGNEKQMMTLNPMEVADFDIQSNQIFYKKEQQLDNYTAWKEGKIVFSDDPIEKMVSRLENWYNVDIEIADNRLKSYHFTATFSGESLDQVLKYLSISTAFNYRFVTPAVDSTGKQERQKIILYRK